MAAGAESNAYIAGAKIIDVPSREEALQWAAKIAAASGCAQEVCRLPPNRPGPEQHVPQARRINPNLPVSGATRVLMDIPGHA